MASRRWYPTATTLADGRVLALSGGTTCLTCIAEVPEIYDPRTNLWTSLPSARLNIPYYPFAYQLPDGRVLDAGANENSVATRTLNVAAGTWTMIDPVVVDGHSSVMYRPGQILKSGTATDSGGTRTVASTAYVIDMNLPAPRWVAAHRPTGTTPRSPCTTPSSGLRSRRPGARWRGCRYRDSITPRHCSCRMGVFSRREAAMTARLSTRREARFFRRRISSRVPGRRSPPFPASCSTHRRSTSSRRMRPRSIQWH